ncbi:ankyrin repeat domain-containing protein [Pedobacter sp. MC2016-14]|uniref:ankyrin repeat domain-containing protein n=1 Tax=Pedobacter sp. MC2016-14 TaxID=2897327 RepID=UPI001E28D800|nr:ankyrin repeat domain-containing protein [Pedobacter sp. MC2016-14]MCD0487365.1 ankyrin repeat domain-containing protein [Pedobacter sp. MC2016-14]
MNFFKKLFLAGIIMFCSCNRDLPGFDFNLFKGTPSYELALAVKNEAIDEIGEIAVQRKISIDAVDPKFGHTLLMLAVANDLKASVKKLLELGADPNKRSITKSSTNEILTPVFICCDHIYKKNYCDTSVLRLLINHGGKVDDEIDIQYANSNYRSIETPLMVATKNDCVLVIKLLVQSGADINKYDYTEGHGPLSNSIVYGNLNVLRYLIIDKKAKIPKYCFVRQAHNESLREELTVTDFLNEQKYEDNTRDYKIRKEILDFLKQNNLR